MSTHVQTNNQWRLAAYSIAAFLFLIVLIARLAQIQFMHRETLEVAADRQYQCEVKLTPDRGQILDRKMRPLALNVPTATVLGYPKKISQPVHVSRTLSSTLGHAPSYYLSRLRDWRDCVTLIRHVPRDEARKIAQMNLSGIEIQSDYARSYPRGRIASQVVGFTSVDGEGLSGVEYSYEKLLRGKPGRAILQRTARNTGLAFERPEYPIVDARDGRDVVLTVDCVYQRIVETELHRTLVEMNADSGSVVVMNPKSGEILAIASEPNFDPNNPSIFHPSTQRLRPITDQFEPGSTFKLVLMAAVLNEGLRSVDDTVFCENGKYEVMGEKLHDTASYGTLSMAEVLIKSSNIGIAKTAETIDNGVIYRYARDFGFGSKTGIELAGEASGKLKPMDEWSGMTPLAMSIGYEVGVTPLQMCNMFGVVANGGMLQKPTLIQAIRRGDQEQVLDRSDAFIRYVIDESTADTLQSLMERVVSEGTGRKAFIDGMQVCGKTGTARMARKGGNGYIPGHYVASFGGFFPREDPKLSIFVSINHPRERYYGGDVAAPCFRRIAERIIAYEGRDYFLETTESEWPKRKSRAVPHFVGFSRDSALKLASGEGLEVKIEGAGELITGQTVAAGTPMNDVDTAVLLMADTFDGEELPDVEGLALRTALNILAERGVQAVVDGSGQVIRQQPPPGQSINPGEQVLLRCESSVDLKKLLVL